MKDIARDLVKGMKLGVHMHVSCYVLNSFLFKRLLLPKNEDRVSSRKDSGEGKSETEERASVDLRPVLQIEDSALNYILAFEYYRQTTAAERAAHRSVIEIVIQFWRPRASRWERFGHENYGYHWKIATHHP